MGNENLTGEQWIEAREMEEKDRRWWNHMSKQRLLWSARYFGIDWKVTADQIKKSLDFINTKDLEGIEDPVSFISTLEGLDLMSYEMIQAVYNPESDFIPFTEGVKAELEIFSNILPHLSRREIIILYKKGELDREMGL